MLEEAYLYTVRRIEVEHVRMLAADCQ